MESVNVNLIVLEKYVEVMDVRDSVERVCLQMCVRMENVCVNLTVLESYVPIRMGVGTPVHLYAPKENSALIVGYVVR
jgi:hypothetical protein